MKHYSETLDRLRRENNFRQLPSALAEREVIDLSSNDYLGIAADSALRREFMEGEGRELSLSASASRLLAADQAEFQRFESLLNDYYGGRVLLFNSGYHANSGAVAALARKGTLIVADKLVHASIIDGIMLSQAPFERFRHNDTAHLERILAKKAADFERVLIIIESVYSMDGDFAPIEEIARIKSRYPNALLYVDEAHALGVCGRGGLGLSVDIEGVDFIIGTLGKAIGSVGAFIVSRSPQMFDYFVNTARSLIFSTALPPLNIAWSRFIMERIPAMEARRTRLRELSALLAQALGNQAVPSHIQPLITGSSESALALSAKLLECGFKVLPIRTPTVPPGTERLRFSLSADLNPDDIIRLKEVMTKL